MVSREGWIEPMTHFPYRHARLPEDAARFSGTLCSCSDEVLLRPVTLSWGPIMRILVSAALLVLLAACDDDPSGPSHPNLRGTYTTSWTYVFDAGEFGSFMVSCPGTLNIAQQSEEEFSGSYTTTATSDEECEASSGTIEGEIRTDGGLNFIIDAPGEVDELEALTGCEVISADNQLNGTFANNVISASADAVLDCPTEFGVLRIALELELLANRT